MFRYDHADVREVSLFMKQLQKIHAEKQMRKLVTC